MDKLNKLLRGWSGRREPGREHIDSLARKISRSVEGIKPEYDVKRAPLAPLRVKLGYALSGALVTAAVFLVFMDAGQPEYIFEFPEKPAGPLEPGLREEHTLRARRMESALMPAEKPGEEDALIEKWQLDDNEIKELQKKLGEKWDIIEQRISEEYITKRLERIQERRSSIQESIDGGYLSEEMAKMIRSRLASKRNFLRSKYFIVNRELVIVPQPVRLSHREEKEVELIDRALEHLSEKLRLPDGAKVVINTDEKHYFVIFSLAEILIYPPMPAADYTAKVVFDKETGEIVLVLGAS